MAKTVFCWRCRVDVPMLEEDEWKEILPYLSDVIGQIKETMKRDGVSLADARQFGWGKSALERYYGLTGYRETRPDNLFHHRISLVGPPCPSCGKPRRTPRAKFCAECGTA